MPLYPPLSTRSESRHSFWLDLAVTVLFLLIAFLPFQTMLFVWRMTAKVLDRHDPEPTPLPDSLSIVTLPYSHYCHKIRWTLQQSRIRFREIGCGATWHMYYTNWFTKGEVRMTPLLLYNDAHTNKTKFVSDSFEIMRFLSKHFPEETKWMQLDDLQVQSMVHKIDDIGQPLFRSLYHYLYNDSPALMLHAFMQGIPSWQQRTMSYMFPLAHSIMRVMVQFDNTRVVNENRDRLESFFDEMDELVPTVCSCDGLPLFIGSSRCTNCEFEVDSFLCNQSTLTAADIALASILYPIVLPPQMEPYSYTMSDINNLAEACPDQSMSALRELAENARKRPTGKYVLWLHAQSKGL